MIQWHIVKPTEFHFPLASSVFSSLYSNVISDEGAESLAAVLPHMSSLTELE